MLWRTDRGVDRTTAARGVPVERGVTVSRSRPRLRVPHVGHDRDGDEDPEVVTAPRSPWQKAYAERLIGSIGRGCLDHVIIANERGLRRVLRAYVEYCLKSRTHLALAKDSPISRPVAPDGREFRPHRRWVAILLNLAKQQRIVQSFCMISIDPQLGACPRLPHRLTHLTRSGTCLCLLH